MGARALRIPSATAAQLENEEPMSMLPRPSGSREEDAWLSDEQLPNCVPAEAEPFRGPLPTRMTSNGEYMPLAQTDEQKRVELRIKQFADKSAKRLGISCRQSL